MCLLTGFPWGSAGKESARPWGKDGSPLQHSWASLWAQLVKNLPASGEGTDSPLQHSWASLGDQLVKNLSAPGEGMGVYIFAILIKLTGTLLPILGTPVCQDLEQMVSGNFAFYFR